MGNRAEFVEEMSIMIGHLDAVADEGNITPYEYCMFTSMCDSAACDYNTKELMLIKDIIAATIALHAAKRAYTNNQYE